MKNTKLNNQAVQAILARKNDPETIYKLHMAQARDALKMFRDNESAQQQIRAAIAKIEQTYKQSKEPSNPEAVWPFSTKKRNLQGDLV